MFHLSFELVLCIDLIIVAKNEGSLVTVVPVCDRPGDL